MKKIITENELANRSASLREKMAQLESQQTDEAWYDPRTWFGGDNKEQPPAAPPAAPAAAPATRSVAGAQAGVNTTPLATPPSNAKAQQYQTALKQIQDLYAKAQVQYPPQDDIVRQRFGLPPALPPLEQWDGKMPQAGQADWLTRNVLGRDASKAVAQQQAANNTANVAATKSDAETAADVKELGTLVAQAKDLLAGKGPAPVSLSEHVSSNLLENITRLNNKLKLMEDPAQDAEAKLKATTPPTLDTTGKDDIRKKIQDLMTKISGNNENPPQDVAQALSDAQAILDQIEQAAKTAPPPVSLAQNNGVNADGQNVGVAQPDGTMINPETGEKYSTGINPETGEKYTPVGESVGYSDEQALARIIHLSRR
jgi:hypothetical protein